MQAVQKTFCATRHNIYRFKMAEFFVEQFNVVEKLFAAIYQNENVHVNTLEKCLLNNSQFLLPELAFCMFPLAIFSELCIHICLNSYIFYIAFA